MNPQRSEGQPRFLLQPVRCAQQLGAPPSFLSSSHHVVLSFCRSRTIVYLAHGALCQQRNAPADCFCPTTPGLCTFPRRDIHQHPRSFFSSKCKRKDSQLCLALRPLLGRQAHAELTLDEVETCICTTVQWQPSFLYSLHSVGRWRCSLHLPSHFHVPPPSLQPAGSEEAEGRLAQTNVPGRKDVLPFSSSLPELRCRVGSPSQRNANPACVSLLTHFAERELPGQLRLCETARKCL